MSSDIKIKVQSFGRFLSNMVMPNIGAFIAWGIITALFIPTGWLPNETLAKLVGPMITYLLPLLIGQPVVNSGYVQQRLGINAPAAQRALRTLTERGVVVERTGYARNRIWEHRGIVGALDEYADTIKRSALSG